MRPSDHCTLMTIIGLAKHHAYIKRLVKNVPWYMTVIQCPPIQW